jgi:hypothetical protein
VNAPGTGDVVRLTAASGWAGQIQILNG